MILRPATEADVAALAPFAAEAFTAAFGHLYRPEDLALFLDEWRTERAYRDALAFPAKRVQLAEVDGKLAAYALIVLGEGFDERPAPKPARPVLLSQLYCAPEATGHGLGAALMEWAIAEARAWHADALQLSVFSENFGAQRFYQRYGFAHVADIDFWVGNHRDDEFLYELAL
ncbi:MAG TPA: GNAT family N-acetyltransferase [Croceibacterium sp.]|nr:GNAT family N-acetyltransferase [Croceibacterium sp.]